MRPHTTICVLKLLYMCPQVIELHKIVLSLAPAHKTSIYVSAYYYIRVLILLYMRPHATIYVSSYYYVCVLILLYMCPQVMELYKIVLSLAPAHETATCNLYHTRHETCDWGAEGEVYCFISVLMLLYMCPHLLYMCPHTICVLILLCVSSCYCICPHATIYVSSYLYTCVLILRYMCPHTRLSTRWRRGGSPTTIYSLLSTLYSLLLSTRYYYPLATIYSLLSTRYYLPATIYSLLSTRYYRYSLLSTPIYSLPLSTRQLYFLLANYTICPPTILSTRCYLLSTRKRRVCSPSLLTATKAHTTLANPPNRH